MTKTTTTVPEGPLGTPSRRRAWTTLLVTLLAAAVLLVVVVLPAEYQIDPTRIGSLLGLDRLRVAAAEDPMYLPPAQAGALAEQNAPFRSETFEIAIGAHEEVEYKFSMVENATVLYTWTVDRGALYEDFHAEPFNDLDDEEVRYSEREDVSSGHGALHVPYSGRHGWYWRNDNDHPVTITLQAAGYFTSFEELYRASASGGHPPAD